MNIKKMEELLRNSKLTLSNELLAALESKDYDLSYIKDTQLETNIAKQTYQTRAKINEEINKEDIHSLGYSDLLSNLENLQDDKIYYVMIPTSKYSYSVFIKDSRTKILGIIKSNNHNLEKAKIFQEYYKTKST